MTILLPYNFSLFRPSAPYDIAVVASFGYLIPNHVLDMFPWYRKYENYILLHCRCYNL